MAKKKDALSTIEAQFAKDIEVSAGMESSVASGNFLSVKGGMLSIDGAPVPGNKIAVVILDTIMENIFYAGKYDPDNMTGPECYAFGRSEAECVPHEKVFEAGTAVADSCEECPNFQWGSADQGKGKACRTTRRLALIPAGTFDKHGEEVELFDKVADFKDSDIVYLKLPVTSVKGYSSMVKQAMASLKRPPYALYTEISVVPDANTQFKVVFKVLDQIPNDLLEVVVARHEEAEGSIVFPYTTAGADEKPAAKGKAKGAKKPAPKTKSKRKF